MFQKLYSLFSNMNNDCESQEIIGSISDIQEEETCIPFKLPEGLPSGLYILFFFKLISKLDIKILIVSFVKDQML